MSTRARQVFHIKVHNDYHYRLCFIFDLGTKKDFVKTIFFSGSLNEDKTKRESYLSNNKNKWKEKNLSLPSTVNDIDWLAEPSIFVAAQMYLPVSARVTWRTIKIPRGLSWTRSDQREPVGCIHFTVGDGFPVAEHWNTAFWLFLTVNSLGEITTVGIEIDSPGSPFAPGKPLRPRFPLIPSSPFWPVGPVGPCFPCGPGCPVSPRAPFLPVVPRGPLLPRDPLGPCLPGGHWRHIFSFGEQNACGVSECKVLFISLLICSMVSFWFSGVELAKRRTLKLGSWTSNEITQKSKEVWRHKKSNL